MYIYRIWVKVTELQITHTYNIDIRQTLPRNKMRCFVHETDNFLVYFLWGQKLHVVYLIGTKIKICPSMGHIQIIESNIIQCYTSSYTLYAIDLYFYGGSSRFSYWALSDFFHLRIFFLKILWQDGCWFIDIDVYYMNTPIT